MSNTQIRPDYYNDTKITCVDAIEQLCQEHQNDAYVDFNRYQAFKYLWRLGKKDDVLSELRKIKTYIEFAIDYVERQRNTPISK